MEDRNDNERGKDVHEDGASGIFGQRVIPSVRFAQAARGVRPDGR
jgi:hypothetical protein